MPARLSKAAYARHRGVTRQAVNYALKVGRIRAGDDGLIDVRAADRAWAANTNPVNGGHRPGAGRKKRAGAPAQTSAPPEPAAAGAGRARRALPVSPAQARAAEPAEPAAGAGPAPGKGFIDAKTTREEWNSKLAELEYRERAGELLERAAIRRLLTDVARDLRDTLYGIPHRVSNLLAAETVPANVHELLEREIEGALGKLSRAFARVGGEPEAREAS